jgi:hypothetical protein
MAACYRRHSVTLLRKQGWHMSFAHKPATYTCYKYSFDLTVFASFPSSSSFISFSFLPCLLCSCFLNNMSFSYGSIPPPESPPLRATPLSPAPARSDRRLKRQTALSPSTLTGIGALSLNDPLSDDPFELDGGRRSDSSLHQLASTLSRENTKRTSTTVIPVPKMINPLPAHYRHPSPAPSTVPSLTASSTQESTASSACSLASKSSTRSRRSLVPKPSLANLRHQDSSYNETSSNDSFSCEPLTPTGATFATTRARSVDFIMPDHPTPSFRPCVLGDAYPPLVPHALFFFLFLLDNF